MNTPSTRKRGWLLGVLGLLLVLCAAAAVVLTVNAYQRDMQALSNFAAAYQAYDRAVAEDSTQVFAAGGEGSPSTGEGERQSAAADAADAALAELNTQASAHISSLVKNEKEAMRLMQAIADLADKELGTLKAYRQAAGSDAEQSRQAQAFHNFTRERQAAFSSFQGLGR